MTAEKKTIKRKRLPRDEYKECPMCENPRLDRAVDLYCPLCGWDSLVAEYDETGGSDLFERWERAMASGSSSSWT